MCSGATFFSVVPDGMGAEPAITSPLFPRAGEGNYGFAGFRTVGAPIDLIFQGAGEAFIVYMSGLCVSATISIRGALEYCGQTLSS